MISIIEGGTVVLWIIVIIKKTIFNRISAFLFNNKRITFWFENPFELLVFI